MTVYSAYSEEVLLHDSSLHTYAKIDQCILLAHGRYIYQLCFLTEPKTSISNISKLCTPLYHTHNIFLRCHTILHPAPLVTLLK